MDLQLAGKKAVVTGSTAGIGFAIAIELAREGAEVVNSRLAAFAKSVLAYIDASVSPEPKAARMRPVSIPPPGMSAVLRNSASLFMRIVRTALLRFAASIRICA